MYIHTAAVNRAYKWFDDEEQVQYCMGVAAEAKEMLESKLEEKRKQAKKDGKTTIEEDDPAKVECKRVVCKWAPRDTPTPFSG